MLTIFSIEQCSKHWLGCLMYIGDDITDYEL